MAAESSPFTCHPPASVATNRFRFSQLRTRVTWVFEKHNNEWKATHVHYSIPVGVPLRMMEWKPGSLFGEMPSNGQAVELAMAVAEGLRLNVHAVEHR